MYEDKGYFAEVDIDAIIEEKCKDPEFKKGFEKTMQRYENNTSKKRFRAIDRVRRLNK